MPEADHNPGVAVTFRTVSTSIWRCLIRAGGDVRIRSTANGSEIRVEVSDGEVRAAPTPGPAPGERSAPRRAKRPRTWRQSTGDIVDGFTLEPLAPEAVAARCPRCRTAYGAESLACLIQRNEGRCAACGSVQVSTRKRRSRRGAG